ncbi:Uncharacterised protein [Mycobacteroides abscessus subsp. abscessus]|nr:Uncharacterised protein [Mycobacteroides abscessus subsp. abscessus]
MHIRTEVFELGLADRTSLILRCPTMCCCEQRSAERPRRIALVRYTTAVCRVWQQRFVNGLCGRSVAVALREHRRNQISDVRWNAVAAG